MNEKAMEKRIANLESKIANAVANEGGEINFRWTEMLGSKDIKGLVQKSQGVYVVADDGTETEMNEFYVVCDTDLTYEDYLIRLWDYINIQ